MFACEPSPGGYSLYVGSDWDNPPTEPGNAIETDTGKRILLDFPDISDGFWKCPYSDYFRIENNWYGVHNFASFREPEVLGTWETPAGVNSVFLGWVLPDAVLLNLGEHQILLFVDGTTREVGFPFRLTPAVWLPDGSYLYTEEGDEDLLHHWKINWDSFEISDIGSFSIPEEMSGHRLSPMPDSRGIFFVDTWDTGNLFFFRLL